MTNWERVAIQGELGSNSHMAALQAVVGLKTIVACSVAAEVFERLASGEADLAVLPIENSLHGSVFEHYDLLHESGAAIVGETMLRIGHQVMAAPGVTLAELRRVMSHPVALSQCRRWLRAHPAIEVVPCYDTAGSVKQLMEHGWRDTAGIAPMLAAEVYGAEILAAGVEDHFENYTRFYLLVRAEDAWEDPGADKMSVAFTLRHEPGTLLRALEVMRDAGLNLTKIESRPVMGRPWEYVFFADVRFEGASAADRALVGMREVCLGVRVLGRYLGADGRRS